MLWEGCSVVSSYILQCTQMVPDELMVSHEGQYTPCLNRIATSKKDFDLENIQPLTNTCMWCLLKIKPPFVRYHHQISSLIAYSTFYSVNVNNPLLSSPLPPKWQEGLSMNSTRPWIANISHSFFGGHNDMEVQVKPLFPTQNISNKLKQFDVADEVGKKSRLYISQDWLQILRPIYIYCSRLPTY